MPDRSPITADHPAFTAGIAPRLIARGAATGRLTHLERLPARSGQRAPWPAWAPDEIIAAFARAGITEPWGHQSLTADLARTGRDVIVATGTASGKSVGYLLPALTAILDGGTVLYLAPTRALAADQLTLVRSLARDTWTSRRGPRLRASVIDSDTPTAQRAWARKHATYLLTTPDMLHFGLLPQHQLWDGFFRRLRYVIVDECHGYRGVFGSHVAAVLRRLRRVADHHRDPGAPGIVFILASATISEPAQCAELLTGRPAEAVAEDQAARGPMTFALWEPPLTRLRGEGGAPVRRTAIAETARMLAELVRDDVPALAFVRSRRGAEAAAAAARKHLTERGAGQLAGRIAAYRSGYLPPERRALEQALRAGKITGLATTTALELGINITGLDAVLIAGWPGTRAALWQQAGRAGRDGRDALAILIARDDPLDTYLVHHPEALLRRPVEATVLDPANPYVLTPHLCAAAAELPLSRADLRLFGPAAPSVVSDLTATGVLRDRGGRWYLTGSRPPLPGLRGTSGRPVRIVEETTGRLVGIVDEPSAHFLAHDGAVYPHQGEMYLVSRLDLADRVALVLPADPGYSTWAREVTGIVIAAELRRREWPDAAVHFGDVEVTRQVVSYSRRQLETGLQIGDVPLDLPSRTLRTRAVWWTVSPAQRSRLAAAGLDLAGSAHAAEHAAIGLLPLVAACDRWDVGGVSSDLHPETGRLTIFVYDGHQGGAGFAERGYAAMTTWLQATAQAIRSCECATGCPSCIQSPKCGNGNEPLSKSGSLALLDRLLAASAGGA